MKTIVMPLPSGDAFAARLAPAIQGKLGSLAVHRFPDGETLVRLNADVKGKCLVLAGSLDHPDDKTLALLFAADAARDLGAAKVILAAPYLGYLRQDTRFHPGEAVTSRTYASLLSQAVDGLVTVDPHLHRHHALSDVYAVAATAVSSAPLIGQWVLGNVPRPLLIGPDGESEQWVAKVAAGASAPWTVMQKIRRADRDVDISLPNASAWLDRTPVLIDDIVSSGATMIAATASLRKAGFAAPTCVVVHALFTASSYQKLLASGVSRIVSCDTVSHPCNAIVTLEPVARAVLALIGQA